MTQSNHLHLGLEVCWGVVGAGFCFTSWVVASCVVIWPYSCSFISFSVLRDFVWWPNRGEQKVLVESSPYFCIHRQPIWGLWFCYWFLPPSHWKWDGHTNLECSIDRVSFFLSPQLSHYTDSRMSHKFDLLDNLSYLCGWKYLKNFQREYEWKDA